MLLSDAYDARMKFAHAEAAQAGIQNAQALADKRDELSNIVFKIERLSARMAVLRAGGVSDLPHLEAKREKDLVLQLRARFSESPKFETLVGGQRWAKFADAVERLAAEVDVLQKKAWKEFFVEVYGGLPPDKLKQTILLASPEHRRAFERYSERFETLQKSKNVVPDNVEVIGALRACALELESIGKGFVPNTDVPTSVQTFFNAVAAGGGAGLNLLSQDVVDWLRENDMLSNYVVRARN